MKNFNDSCRNFPIVQVLHEIVFSDKFESIKDELLSVVSYNVLSQTLLEKHQYLYNKHDSRSLKWKTRSQTLLEEFSQFDADVSLKKIPRIRIGHHAFILNADSLPARSRSQRLGLFLQPSSESNGL